MGTLVRTVLEVYEDVSAGGEDKTKTATPATGPFELIIHEAEADFDLNTAVKVLFDGNIVWGTKGSLQKTVKKKLVGNGVKKVELWLDAIDLPSGSVLMGAKLEIKQET